MGGYLVEETISRRTGAYAMRQGEGRRMRQGEASVQSTGRCIPTDNPDVGGAMLFEVGSTGLVRPTGLQV